MKVIIFGISGYTALPIANALVNNGHIVVGVSRNDKQSNLLIQNEIIPLVGDIFDSSVWGEHLQDADAVLDCTGGDISVVGKKLFDAIVAAAPSVRPQGVPKIAYIYTSGTWVHGDNRTTFRSDGSPLPNPPKAVAWRPALEQEIIASQVVRGIVIRPALCYGRSGSLFGLLFSQADKGEISWFGTPGGSFATIHVDDLAQLFLLAVEKNHLISGLIIDGSTYNESVDGILHAFAAHVGITWDKVAYRPPTNPLEEAMSGTAKLRPTLARALLGWEPRKASVTDGIATYYASYKASDVQLGLRV